MAKGQLVLPPQFSRRLLASSLLSLVSLASAAYNGCNGCLGCATLVLLTSINYWRHPLFGAFSLPLAPPAHPLALSFPFAWLCIGVRRNLDILACAGSLAYQLSVAAKGEPGPRNAYFSSVAAGLGCYGFSRYYSFTRCNKDVSSWFHCGLHFFGNVGNLILYDSLGVNWLGWKRKSD